MHLLLRSRELDDLAGPRDRFVRRVRQLQLDGVRTRLQADDDDRFTARVDDRPRLAVHVVVQMSDPWRHAESRVPEHRQYPQVFGAVLDEHAPERQLLRNGRVDDQFCRRLVRNGDERSCALTSLAVCAAVANAMKPIEKTPIARFAVMLM